MARFTLDPLRPPTLDAARRRRLETMTDDEIAAAAASDPDNPPLGDDPVFILVNLRRRLGLSQADFAARYGIPIGTLRDWEQGRTRPDAAAVAYIRVIDAMPEAVAGALNPAA